MVDGLLYNHRGQQHSLLSPLDYPPAKAGGAVNGGAVHNAPFILTVDWLGWLCHSKLFNIFRPNIIKLYNPKIRPLLRLIAPDKNAPSKY